MFISNLWVVLMIRIVTLMIGLPSTVNLFRKRRTLYENVNQMEVIWFTFANENVNRMTPIQFIIFFQNVNRMRCHPIHIFIWKMNHMASIRFNILKKKKVLLISFRRTVLTFSKLMKLQDEGIEVQKCGKFRICVRRGWR